MHKIAPPYCFFKLYTTYRKKYSCVKIYRVQKNEEKVILLCYNQVKYKKMGD
jgi:hypothetical protein